MTDQNDLVVGGRLERRQPVVKPLQRHRRTQTVNFLSFEVKLAVDLGQVVDRAGLRQDVIVRQNIDRKFSPLADFSRFSETLTGRCKT